MRLTPPFSGVSANQHADPTPRLRGGDLLIIDGLELRRSRTPLSRAHQAPLRAQGPQLVQIWIPDVTVEGFAAEAHRQSRLVAAGEQAEANHAFADAVPDWPGS